MCNRIADKKVFRGLLLIDLPPFHKRKKTIHGLQGPKNPGGLRPPRPPTMFSNNLSKLRNRFFKKFLSYFFSIRVNREKRVFGGFSSVEQGFLPTQGIIRARVLALRKIPLLWYCNHGRPFSWVQIFSSWVCTLRRNSPQVVKKLGARKKFMFVARYCANPWVWQKMVLEYFLEDTLGYSMKIKFWSHTPSLFSKITILWHPSVKIFTSGGFLQKRMSRKNYEKSGMSENMFLKTYKKISRFVRSVFAKKTKTWPKILRLRRLRDLQHFLSPNSAVSAWLTNKPHY